MFAHVEPPTSVVAFGTHTVDARTSAEAAIDELRSASCDLIALAGAPSIRMHRVASSMHRIAAALEECEAAGLDRDTLLPVLGPVRDLHAQSPFAHRLQTWPRGYPGDFETVEWLCDSDNRARRESVGWAIEQFALQSPVAQQHRNKVAWQAETMRTAIAAHPEARIASIGCGGCRDLRLLAPSLRESRATFTLIDADAAALDFAEACLGPLAARCVFVHGRVPRVLSRVRPHGPFDLVVAGGLFDYLPDRWAVETLRHARGLLRPRGTLVFSNIVAGNPYRLWIEYLADWFLLERTDGDLLRLLRDAGFDEARTSIRRDGTGLASMVSAQA